MYRLPLTASLPEHRNLPDSIVWRDVAVLSRLSCIRHGFLTLVEGDCRHQFGDPDAEVCATVTVTDSRFFADVAFAGTIGGGEAYIRNYWYADSITNVVRIFAKNRQIARFNGVRRVTPHPAAAKAVPLAQPEYSKRQPQEHLCAL